MPWIAGLLMRYTPEIAHYMALLPLAVMAWLRLLGQRRASAWVWLSIAFAISTGADSLSEHLPKDDRWWPTLVYPVIQTGLISLVLLPPRVAVFLVTLLIVLACNAALWLGFKGPDVLLHSIASLSVVWMAQQDADMPRDLLAALVIYFGVGWVAWLVFAQAPMVPAWCAYQGVRLLGLLVFSYAMVCTAPYPRVIPRRVDDPFYAG